MPRCSRRASTAAILALALLVLAPGAWAGGPFQPPDGVGNPSGNDYTGYQTVGYVHGVRHNVALGLLTRIYCTNTGGVNADDLVVQFYDSGDNPTRPPVSDIRNFSLPIGDLDFVSTSGVFGASQDNMIARVLALDSVKKKSPAIVCQVNVETSVGATIGQLTFHTPAKKKKR